MTKFAFLFVVVLCLAQNFPTTCAESEEEKASIQNIVTIVEDLASDIKLIIQDLSDRLPQIVKRLEKNIKEVVNEISITEIFQNVKEDIEKLISDGSSTALECSKMAADELEDLTDKTKSDVANCVSKAQNSAINVKEEVQVLMQKANSLANSMKNKIEKCAEKFGEDAIGMSDCLQHEIKAIKELLKQLKEAIKETVDVTDKIAEEVATEVGDCLKEVKIDALKNTEHVTEELETCINEA